MSSASPEGRTASSGGPKFLFASLLILLVAANALALAFWNNPTLQGNDNRFTKLLFWPCTAASFYAVSILYLR